MWGDQRLESWVKLVPTPGSVLTQLSLGASFRPLSSHHYLRVWDLMIQAQCRRLVPLDQCNSYGVSHPRTHHGEGAGPGSGFLLCPTPGCPLRPHHLLVETPPQPAPSPSAAINGRRDGGLWRGLTCRGGGRSTQGDLGILPALTEALLPLPRLQQELKSLLHQLVGP